VRRLLEELRVGRGQPKVPEMSELLMKYFKGTKRTKGEGMSDYVTRKAEAYTRAQHSMARYLQEQKSGASWSNRPQSSWNTGHSQNMGSSVTADLQDTAGDDEDRWEAYSQVSSAAARVEEAPSQEQRSSRGNQELELSWWRQQGWDDYSHRRPWGNYGGWHSEVTYDTTEWGRGQLPEIVPAFVQGWYLFIDSGLDVMERNVLQAELRGDFSVQAVEDVLRRREMQRRVDSWLT